jgi:hypothetical protein
MEVITRKEALERGLPTYWTGKRCHARHLAKRYVDNYGCATCMAASHKRWRNSLGGEWNERAARYRRDNPEKWRETYRRSQKKCLARKKERDLFQQAFVPKPKAPEVPKIKPARMMYAKSSDLFQRDFLRHFQANLDGLS